HIDGHQINTRLYGLKRRPSLVEANDLVNMGGEPPRMGIADRGGSLYRVSSPPVASGCLLGNQRVLCLLGVIVRLSLWRDASVPVSLGLISVP
ncbi:MAG: hypothetical protein QOF83_430, partial [Solirubrobacteraceae bacterium]|nr:hypothetical protein [Solirubrobacteraceae bacterium]